MSSEGRQSIMYIKPEAMDQSNLIVSIISRRFHVTRRKHIILRRREIECIYDGVPKDILIATIKVFSGRKLIVCTVIGQSSLDRLRVLCGTSVDPRKCRPSSLRARFGVKSPYVICGSKYFRNAIHRSISAQEAHQQISLLFR